jgi:hypothetical protein
MGSTMTPWSTSTMGSWSWSWSRSRSRLDPMGSFSTLPLIRQS